MKLKLVAIGISVSIALFVGWLLLSSPPYHSQFDKALRTALNQPAGSSIPLSELAEFEWTRFCVVPPYGSQQSAEELIGAAWPGRWWSLVNDDQRYYVFVDNDEVVSVLKRQNNGVPYIRQAHECRTREEAVLRVVIEQRRDREVRFFDLEDQGRTD